MDYVEPDELDDSELTTEEDMEPEEVTIRVCFKSGAIKDVVVSLPVTSTVYDATLTTSNILEYVSSPYNFTEGAYLALPTDTNGSHIFIDISATDYVEVIR